RGRSDLPRHSEPAHRQLQPAGVVPGKAVGPNGDHMTEREQERPFTLDQLPDDPLKMPPPYWRGCGAIFHIEDALAQIDYLLHDLIPLHAETETRLAEHYEKYPEYNEDDEEALEH